jgi:CheY-like chemotaxis protein
MMAKINLREAAKNISTTPDAAEILRNKQVLLAEDNRVNQVLAMRLLQKFGIDPDLAQNGAEALQLLAEKTYDLVLMDIQMPVMDGLEATRIIRLDPRFAQLPVVAMSAGVTLNEQALCVEAGMSGFIGKPIDFNELKNTLLEQIARSSPALSVGERS